MSESSLVHDLAVILASAACLGFVCHLLRQPPIIGYLLAGVLIGPHSIFPSPVFDFPNVHLWGQLGVIFVMFQLGLEFNIRRLASLSVSLLLAGVFEVAIMLGLGTILGSLLGFSKVGCFFIAGIAAISSTTVIIKVLEDAGRKTSRFAEYVFGVLIVEDILAVFLLLALTTVNESGATPGLALVAVVTELTIAIFGWFVILGLVLPRLVKPFAKLGSAELLTLLALASCLVVAVLSARLHLSAALGAFAVGSIISASREAEKIARLVHPLRDVFAAIFFVSVGMTADFQSLGPTWPQIVLIVPLIIIGKFLAVFSGSVLAGINIKTAARMALVMGQIGEFSFLIASLGVLGGRLPGSIQAALVFAAIATAMTSAVSVKMADRMADFLEVLLPKRVGLALDHYAHLVFKLRDERLFPPWLRRGAIHLAANAALVGLLFNAGRRYLLPLVRETSFLAHPMFIELLSLALTLALCGPFIYGMFTAWYRAPGGAHGIVENSALAFKRRFIFALLSILWLGTLSAQFLSHFESYVVAAVGVTIFMISSFRFLGRPYRWLESHYLSGLRHEKGETAAEKAMRRLAPWDAHLTRLTVHANSPVAGVPIQLCGLRTLHGLMILAIQRGGRLILGPDPSELLLPSDELLILGSDEQLERARPEIEASSPAADRTADGDLADFDLQSFVIDEKSGLAGLTIRDTKFRERFGTLIVGLEREGTRKLNPSPAEKFAVGDMVWVVGPRTDFNAV